MLVETTRGAYLASCTYRVGKGAGAWRYHPPPYIAEVRERVDLYMYPASSFMACYKLRFTLFLLMLPVTWDVWHMGKKTAAYTIWWGKNEEKNHLEDLGMDGWLC